MLNLKDSLQRGWQYLKEKIGSAYRWIKKHFVGIEFNIEFGDVEFFEVNIVPLRSELCEKKDLLTFIFYASSALFHRNMWEAEWATYHILKYLRAPLLSDWPVPSRKVQLAQDLLFHRLCLQWASYFQEQGDLVSATDWYQLITERHPEYYKTACYELGNIALICATELQEAVLTADATKQEAEDYQKLAQDYLTKAALLGENDAQRLLDRLANKTPVQPISLPYAKTILSMYEKIEAILQANHQAFAAYFLSPKKRNFMRTEKQPESNLTEELAHEPVKIAKQKFDEQAQQTRLTSLSRVNDAFTNIKDIEISNESFFIKTLKNAILLYQNYIDGIKDVTNKKYGEALYNNIEELIKPLTVTIETAVTHKDDSLVVVKLKELEALDKNIGYYKGYIFYSDPFSVKKFRNHLKAIATMADRNPLVLYQPMDRHRLNTVGTGQQQVTKIVDEQHEKLIEHHRDAESILVSHIDIQHEKITQVEQKLTDFENGEEYQRLRELPAKLEQQLLKAREESKTELEQQLLKAREESKTELEQQIKAQKESNTRLEQQLVQINQRLNSYEVYKEKLHSIRCPLSDVRMREPVIAEDGYTYERAYIQSWLQDVNISPITQKKIGKSLIPNYAMKTLIDEYLAKRQKARGKQGFFPHGASSSANNEQDTSTNNNTESPRFN